MVNMRKNMPMSHLFNSNLLTSGCKLGPTLY